MSGNSVNESNIDEIEIRGAIYHIYIICISAKMTVILNSGIY